MKADKIIDIKRSFIPIDPNAFPENYHTTQREDQPDESAPVVPYMGANFIPTSYGYKSFFGMNYRAAIDTLSPSKAEYVFLFQNLAYSNTLIALCDTGIFAKNADTNGAWTQLAEIDPPVTDTYYEWFFEIIKNKLYAFRGNGAAYYVIATNISEFLGIDITPVVPSFITIGAQLGLFKLGSRLGFWDAENAVAWSSPDDLSDFTPSALTGANVTTFVSITGKISAIRSHGRHAIAYASKSITLLNTQPTDTFLVRAEPIINAGVPYNRQSVVGSPTTTHFCHATTGIYKIENGKAEPIVPEVFDFFKQKTDKPVYLKLINNRFLAFEILDPGLASGIPNFSIVDYPPEEVVFPGFTSFDDIQVQDQNNVDWCDVLKKIDSGEIEEMDEAANIAIPDKKPGTNAVPIWTCYISEAHGPADPIVWGHVPCGPPHMDNPAEWFEHSPATDNGKLSGWSQDSSNKTAKTGDAVYQDGKWTMERFIAYQTAIWERQQKGMDKFIGDVSTKQGFVQQVVENQTNCVASTPGFNTCLIGEYPSKFSPPQFGYNLCSFWLTRFALEKTTIRNKNRIVISCEDPGPLPILPVAYTLFFNGSIQPGDYGTPAAALAGVPPSGSNKTMELLPNVNMLGTGTNIAYSNSMARVYINGNYSNYTISAKYQAGPGKIVGNLANGVDPGQLPSVVEIYEAGHLDKKFSQDSHNEKEVSPAGVWGAETAYCEITGWEYTKEDGTKGIAAATSCLNTENKHPVAGVASIGGSVRSADPNEITADLVNPNDGSVCGISLGDTLDDVEWPDESTEYSEVEFLFQDGSIAPRWPTVFGFYCYDLHLKKWGKQVGEYKQLLDYLPINSESSSPLLGENQAMLAGVLKENGFLYLFNDNPKDSFLTWGKIGFYRAGMTDLQEVEFKFAKPATGSVVIDLSNDGKSVVETARFEERHTDVMQVTVYPPYTGKWYNVTVKGKYDVTDLTAKGQTKGRR